MRHRLLAVSCVSCLLSALQLLSTPALAEKQKLSIAVSGFASWFYLQQHVAIGAGLYQAEGLEPDAVDTNSGTRQAAAVMGGTAEIGQFSFPHVIKSAAKGGGLVAIATGYDAYPIQLVLDKKVAEKAGIVSTMPVDERIRRIKGMKIAISGPGASTDLFMRTILIVRGLDPDKEVTLMPVGAGAPEVSALEAGAVDGFSFGPPFTTEVVARGRAIMLADPMSGELPEFRGAPYQIVATSRRTLEDKPDVLRKALRAIRRAQLMIREKPDEAKKAARSWYKTLSDTEYDAQFEFHKNAAPMALTINDHQFKRTVELMNLTEKEKFTLGFNEAVSTNLANEVDSGTQKK